MWVTKFAPPGRVADYMSIHTFFTGVRGLIAPLVAFHLIARLPFHLVGWICAGLILIGTALLVPEIQAGKGARKAAPLVEEVSD